MASELQKEELVRFGKHLTSLRKKKKLSYRKLAQNCNIDYANIKKYEKGEYNVTLLSLLDLAKGLGIEPKELLDY